MTGLKKAAVVVGIGAFLFVLNRKAEFNSAEAANLRVVVTGASKGIGEQVAYKFARLGAKVLVTARRESKLKKVVEKCKSLGAPEAYFVAVALNGYDNATKVIDVAIEKFGGIDVLVLNHVGLSYYTGYKYDVKHIENLMMVNMLTHAHMVTVAMETLRQNRGRIAVTSTNVVTNPMPHFLPYGTTKWALEGFFNSLRIELKWNQTDVSVSVAHLGLVDTDMAHFVLPLATWYLNPADECASEIVRGLMMRESDIYFSNKWYSWLPLIRFFSPSIADHFVLLVAKLASL